MSAANPLAPGASQQDYWQVLESYERHLAAKRQKTQSWKSHLPAAERHIPTTVEEQLQVIEPAEAAPAVLDRPATLVEAALGPEAPMVAPQAAAATSTAAAPAAPAPLEDVADVLFIHSFLSGAVGAGEESYWPERGHPLGREKPM